MLRVEKLSAGYGGGDVLHGVSFELAAGENLAVIGPNGCGKTTLLKAVAGLLHTSGEVTIDGLSISSMSRREIARKVALLSQTPAMQGGFTVREAVMLGRYAHSRAGLLGRPGARDIFAVDEALGAVDLLPLGGRDLFELSGGQLQRVFVARALAQCPQVILLDEPTNHLDLCHQVELINYLRAWSQTEKRSVVGVLHDINLAAMLADKILLISEGRSVALGDVSEVLSADIIKDVYGMDIAAYMRQSLERWTRMTSGEQE